MDLELSGGLDLSARLVSGIEAYRVTWQAVDDELYDLCRERPSHNNFADLVHDTQPGPVQVTTSSRPPAQISRPAES